MQRFIVTAALFAGLTLSQDLSQIQALPPCGVSISPCCRHQLTASWPFANENPANMYQQHVGPGTELRMLNLRLGLPLQQHEFRLWRPRLLSRCLRCSRCRPNQYHRCRKQLLLPFAHPPPHDEKQLLTILRRGFIRQRQRWLHSHRRTDRRLWYHRRLCRTIKWLCWRRRRRCHHHHR